MSLLKPKELLGSFKLASSNWGFSWKGLISNHKGEWWLIGQLALLVAHISPAWPSTMSHSLIWPSSISTIGATTLALGFILAVIALMSLGTSLSPLPEPKQGGNLVTYGSYSYCRHPLYQALLISSIGLAFYLGSLLHILLFIGLCILLKGKALREEKKLLIVYKEYRPYMTRTPAIIKGLPFLDWRNHSSTTS